MELKAISPCLLAELTSIVFPLIIGDIAYALMLLLKLPYLLYLANSSVESNYTGSILWLTAGMNEAFWPPCSLNPLS
jgi:hypothetical protein